MGTNVYAPGTRLGDSLASSGQNPQAAVPLTNATLNPINPQAGTYDQIQQSPEWLQNIVNARVMQNPNQAGYYDQGLQTRDIFSNFAPDIRGFQQRYGDSFYNPYFAQNQKEFGGQMSDPGFNPFRQNLFDYQLGGRMNDVYKIMRDPFTGSVAGTPQIDSYRKQLEPRDVSWGVTGPSDNYGSEMDRVRNLWSTYQPYLDGMSWEDYLRVSGTNTPGYR